MNSNHHDLLNTLRASGWRIELFERRQPLPAEIVDRYPWMPPDYRAFAEETKIACSADEKAWLLTALDFTGQSDSAFGWNEWERQSLEAAGDSGAAERQVELFWRSHLPILLSVRSEYGYFAIEETALSVVAGEGPEYETPTPLAQSFAELLRLIASGDPRIARWS